MFGFDEKVEDEAQEDISAARDYFLKELERAPFAPALSGELLARFSIAGSLANFVRTHLPEACFLGTVGNPRQSPVGKPALALTAKIRDVKYWQGYRLSSLYTAWPDVKVDLSALDRPVAAAANGLVSAADAAEFEKQFPVGRHIRGRVIRRAFRVPGYVLSVDGETITTAFLPDSAMTDSDRALGDGMIGLSGIFEVISTRPAKRSVWVRRLSAAAAAAVAAAPKAVVQEVVRPAATDGAGDDDFELRLKRAQNLYSKGLITEAEYKATREKIISSL
jgi:hypothetical protein